MLQQLEDYNTFVNLFDIWFMRKHTFVLISLLFIVPFFAVAQQTNDVLLQEATLENVIQYAIRHNPSLQQSFIDQEVTDQIVNANLSNWGPQINATMTPQHNFQKPSTVIAGVGTKASGSFNSSPFMLTATQNLVNRDAIMAAVTAKDQRKQSKQNTESVTIDMVVNVSKAFYAVLATQQQIGVGQEEITRLARSLKDAENRYNAGTSDKTDYKRAAIALNNSRATFASNIELLKANKEYLKSLIGYPTEQDLNVVYDSIQMEQQISIDTFNLPNYQNRIEYQQLLISQKLQKANLDYSYFAFMPNIAINAAYAINFYSDPNSLKELYKQPLPYNYVALAISLPIFQGGKRAFNIKQQKLTLDRIDYDITNLKNSVNSEHAQAIANYKSYLINYEALRENLALAQDVYDVINLQYKSGVKTYLEVVTAETDLHNAKINYYNGLYQVLSAKMDLLKALGQVKW